MKTSYSDQNPGPEPRAPLASPRVDWGEALTVPNFYGRRAEQATLTQWILQEDCRVVCILGMGGIGKSALSVNIIHQLSANFEVVIFRSLRDAPSCEALLDDCLQALSPQPLNTLPATLEQRFTLLLEYLRKTRTFLILDNLECLLQEGDVRGHFRSGFKDYELLLHRVVETVHQSCLLFTSREKPAKLRLLEGRYPSVRTLRLTGLDVVACQQFFVEKAVVGSQQEQESLIEAYTGNPLALKIVAETIVDRFGSEMGQFLAQGHLIFGSINALLDEQFVRLSALEQTILCWLAIMREPSTLDELLVLLVPPLPRLPMLLEAIDALRRRSLVERGKRSSSFTLQSVVLEYVTLVLITEGSREIQQRRLSRLLEHGLSQAIAREYVRQTQERLLIAPLLAELQNSYPSQAEIEAQLLVLFDDLREQDDDVQGYGPANLVSLLRLLRGDLKGLDLSDLSIRGAYLQGIGMQGASLSGTIVRDTLFTEAFDATWAVTISPNGQYWAAGSKRGEVRVWRERGQHLHLAWLAHTDGTYALAFSPDGGTLASGGLDGAVKLWELHQGTLLWTGWHSDVVRSVAFAPDGRTLASGGEDAIVQFWEVTSGTKIQTLAAQSGAVHAVAWSPDGSLLASSSFDGSIRLWHLQGAQPATCVGLLVGHTHWVSEMAFAPNGTQLASGSWDGTVRLWDVESLHLRQTLSGHTKRVHGVAWSADGRLVASAGYDNIIWLWDVERSCYRAALHGHTSLVHRVVFTPDCRTLLSGSEDGTVRVWDVASGQCVRVVEGYAVSLFDVAWSPDGTRLASAGSDTLVTLWEVVGGVMPLVLRGHSWNVLGVVWSPDGKCVASSGRDNAIRIWEATTGACLQILQDPDYVDTIFQGVAWSPDGRLLASGSLMRGVHVWDVTGWTRRWVGRMQPTRIRRVAWSPDGTRLASSGDDGNVCLWNAADGVLLGRLQGHSGGVMCVAWSPDGTRLASGGGGRGSGELFVWDGKTGEPLQTLQGHPGSVFALAWSPTGEVLLSGSSDGNILWWQVRSGECLRTCKGHDGTVQSLKISPDGRLLASSGDDSTIRLWDLESVGLLRTLRQDRPYERLNITGVRGLNEAQKSSLQALGAIEDAVS